MRVLIVLVSVVFFIKVFDLDELYFDIAEWNSSRIVEDNSSEITSTQITGPFGYKLGQHFPDGTSGQVENYRDDFFDKLKIFLTPKSKEIYSIEMLKHKNSNSKVYNIITIDEAKEDCIGSTEYKAMRAALFNKYKNLYEGKDKFVDVGRELTLYCSEHGSIVLDYFDNTLYRKKINEAEAIKKRNQELENMVEEQAIENLKKKIDAKNL